MELEEIKDNLFEFIHINGYLDLYNPGNASIPIKTIDSWRKNVKALCDIATKQEMMIQKIHENFCKFDWKNSNGEEVHNQLKELYESIFKNEESE